MYEEKREWYMQKVGFFMLDYFMMLIALFLTYVMKLAWVHNQFIYIHIGLMIVLFNLVSAYAVKSYQDILNRSKLKELNYTIMHVSIIVTLIMSYIFLINKEHEISRMFIVQLWISGIFFMYLARLGVKYLVCHSIKKQKKDRQIVLISTFEMAIEMMQAIEEELYRDYEISKIILVDDLGDTKEILGVSAMPFGSGVLEYLKTNIVDGVLIHLPLGMTPANGLIESCYQMGIPVHTNLVPEKQEEEEFLVENFAGFTILTSNVKLVTRAELIAKRCLDIVGGLVGTGITIILTLILGPMIYLKDPGPIFFAQERVGKNGRKFKIYKFRSMYLDAEERKKELMKQNQMSGHMFKMENDPRILPGIGNKIRDWSLDEFPQFINVLKGDMSLIGTRPPTVDEWEQYDTHHHKRLAIKPGITGMWQVSGRSDIKNFEEVVALDSQYIQDWSLGLDVKILLKTVLVVLGKEGAR